MSSLLFSFLLAGNTPWAGTTTAFPAGCSHPETAGAAIPGPDHPRAGSPSLFTTFPGDCVGSSLSSLGVCCGRAGGLVCTVLAVHAARAGPWPGVNSSFVFLEKYEGLYSVELTRSPTRYCAATCNRLLRGAELIVCEIGRVLVVSCREVSLRGASWKGSGSSSS